MGCGASSKKYGKTDSADQKAGSDTAQSTGPTACFGEVIKVQKERVTKVYKVSPGALGEGGFGKVGKGVHRVTNDERAIKQLSKKLTNATSFATELDIAGSLDHPNIVKLYEVFEDQTAYYMAMELCVGGELFDAIVTSGHFSERQTAIVMHQVLSGVNYMHKQCICHRDIKPENFLLQSKAKIQDAVIKIVDFGLACRFDPAKENPLTLCAGTAMYVAPQVLDSKYNHQCDVWSCGILLYIMLSGSPPFFGKSDAATLALVKEAKLEFPAKYWKSVSNDAKDLVKGMICLDPKVRLSADAAMNFEWIQKRKIADAKREDTHFEASHLASLRAFCGHNKLKRAALQIISRRLKEEDVQHLRAVFQKLDTNNDGVVTYEELQNGVSELKGGDVGDQLKEMMGELDENKTATIDYTEFLAATVNRRAYQKEAVLWSAFVVFDKDGNGVITRKELVEVLSGGEVQAILGTTVDQILSANDANSDDQIDFQEFMEMMRDESTAGKADPVPPLS